MPLQTQSEVGCAQGIVHEHRTVTLRGHLPKLWSAWVRPMELFKQRLGGLNTNGARYREAECRKMQENAGISARLTSEFTSTPNPKPEIQTRHLEPEISGQGLGFSRAAGSAAVGYDMVWCRAGSCNLC